MSAYTYMTASGVVSNVPVVLRSVVITTDGGGPGKVVLYDGQGAESSYIIATLLCSANQTVQFHWDDLELDRGLYMQLVEKADYITIEWKPEGYKQKQAV